MFTITLYMQSIFLTRTRAEIYFEGINLTVKPFQNKGRQPAVSTQSHDKTLLNHSKQYFEKQKRQQKMRLQTGAIILLTTYKLNSVCNAG